MWKMSTILFNTERIRTDILRPFQEKQINLAF